MIKDNLKKVFFIFLIACSTICLLISLKNAIIYSGDFQRSGSVSLLKGLEPYAEFLKGDINKIFIKSFFIFESSPSNNTKASFLNSDNGSFRPYCLRPITCLSCSKY